MHRQTTGHQAPRDAVHDVFRLLPSAAMNHRIIGIAGKGTLRQCLVHPAVEGVVQEQIHQEWADHTALRGTTIPGQ